MPGKHLDLEVSCTESRGRCKLICRTMPPSVFPRLKQHMSWVASLLLPSLPSCSLPPAAVLGPPRRQWNCRAGLPRTAVLLRIRASKFPIVTIHRSACHADRITAEEHLQDFAVFEGGVSSVPDLRCCICFIWSINTIPLAPAPILKSPRTFRGLGGGLQKIKPWAWNSLTPARRVLQQSRC